MTLPNFSLQTHGGHTVDKVSSRVSENAVLPFVALLYILNGNHDPRKVQLLNIVLAAVFCFYGFFFDGSLMSIGILMIGVAILNGATAWIVRSSGVERWNPLESDLLFHVRRSLHRNVGK